MIGTKVRLGVYVALAVGGLIVGSLNEWFLAEPAWLEAVTRVYVYLAGPAGILAALNVADGEAFEIVGVESDTEVAPSDDEHPVGFSPR